ncbi:MAG: hypothetical protein JNK85_03015 [Verrucomicrobiales bacterium]|nr:hypothetical protein [Verrucomicrobiales bacterium]
MSLPSPAATLRSLASWPGYATGPIFGLHVTNGMAFAAADRAGLIILDVADPQHISPLGGFLTRGSAYDVVVRGTTAFVADWSWGLTVLDVANPREPVLVSTTMTDRYSTGVAIEGDFAVVSSYEGYLTLFDVTDVTGPIKRSSIGTGIRMTAGGEVALAGGFAFAVGSQSQLTVVDCRNPLRMSVVGSLGSFGLATGIATSSDRLYAVDANRGLRIFDRSKLSTRTMPELGSLKTTSASSAVATDGSLVCVGEGWGGVEVVDARVPATPKRVAAFGTEGDVSALAMVGQNRLYVGQDGAPFQIWSLENPAAPALLGSFDISSVANDVKSAGDSAFIAAGGAGLRVLDVQDRSQPKVVGALGGLGLVRRLAMTGTQAILAAEDRGVHVVDVADPSRPRLVSTYDSPGYAYDVAASGSLVVVADLTGGFRVVDITTPETPRPRGALTNLLASGVALRDDLALVAAQSGGLALVDVSVPSEPRIVGQGQAPGTERVAVAGNLAFTLQGTSFSIFDISDRTKPVLLSKTPAFGCMEILVRGTWAFVAMNSPSIVAFDISQPTQPVRGAEWTDTFQALGLVMNGDTLLAALGGGGLSVVKFDEMAATSPRLALRWDSGVPRLNVTDAGSSPWNIEFSDGLELGAGWSPLTNVVPSGGQAEAVDPNPAAPRRFYRAVQR